MPTALIQPWREARRGRLLEAASRVFAARPFADVSMDEIARACGVGKPTLYRYFPSKDALYQAVFIHALDGLEARLAKVLSRHACASERLLCMVREIVPTFRDHLVSLRLLGDGAASLDISKRRIFRDRRARIASQIAACLDDGVAASLFRPCDTAAVAQMMIGMMWSATATGSADDDVIATEVTDLVLHGVMPVREATPSTMLPPPSPPRRIGSVVALKGTP
jgi:AcrR family transcriptional regulator